MRLITCLLLVFLASIVNSQQWTRENLTEVFTHDFVADIITDYDFNSSYHRENLSIPSGLIDQSQYSILTAYGLPSIIAIDTCYRLIVPSRNSILAAFSTVEGVVNSHLCSVFDSDKRLLTAGLKTSNYITMWITCPNGIDQYRALSNDTDFYQNVALVDHCVNSGTDSEAPVNITPTPIPYNLTNIDDLWDDHIKPSYLDIPCSVDYSKNIVGSFILIDTGVDFNHPEFAGTGRVVPLSTATTGPPDGVFSDSHNNLRVNHGTQIAAILAGKKLSIFNNSMVYVAKVVNNDDSLSYDGIARAFNEAIYQIGTNIISRPVMVVSSLIYIGDQSGCIHSKKKYDACFGSTVASMQLLYDLGVVVTTAAGNGFLPINIEALCYFCGSYYNLSYIEGDPSEWAIPQNLHYYREQIFDYSEDYHIYNEYAPLVLLDSKKPVIISSYQPLDGDIPMYGDGLWSAGYGDGIVEFSAPANFTTFTLISNDNNTSPYHSSLGYSGVTWVTSFANGVGATYLMSQYYSTGIDGITWNANHTKNFIDKTIELYTVPHSTVNEYFEFTGIQTDTINTTNLIYGVCPVINITTGITTISTGDISTGEVTTELSTGITSKSMSTGITSKSLSTGITSKSLSTGITSKSMSTGITTKSLSTGITTKSVSTGITTKLITTQMITTQMITTGIGYTVTQWVQNEGFEPYNAYWTYSGLSNGCVAAGRPNPYAGNDCAVFNYITGIDVNDVPRTRVCTRIAIPSSLAYTRFYSQYRYRSSTLYTASQNLSVKDRLLITIKNVVNGAGYTLRSESNMYTTGGGYVLREIFVNLDHRFRGNTFDFCIELSFFDATISGQTIFYVDNIGVSYLTN